MKTAVYAKPSEKSHEEGRFRIALAYAIVQHLRGFESVASVVAK